MILALKRKLWYIYVIKCSDETFYTGITVDITRRLEEHNSSDRKGARYVKTRRPAVLVYYETCYDRGKALVRELAIKKMSKKAKIKLTENNITEELVKLSYFTETGKSIASAVTIRETLNKVMEHVGRIFSPCNWSLQLKTGNGDLKFVTVVGEAAQALEGKVIKKGRGITGWIAENGVPLIIEDVAKDSRFDNSFDLMSGFETKSIIGVPLKSGGKVFGVIELVNKLDGTNFSALDLKLLTTIADFAAIAIEKAYYLANLKKLVNIDPLTGAYNRRFLVFYLEKELKRSKRDKTVLSILFIDIDDFKKINDTYGHSAGDKVLKTAVRVLNASVRESDMVFRFGGDEFVVLLPKTSVEDASAVKDRIQDNLKMSNSNTGFPFYFTIGCEKAAGESIEDVLYGADSDMYINKMLKKEESITDLAEHITDEVCTGDGKEQE